MGKTLLPLLPDTLETESYNNAKQGLNSYYSNINSNSNETSLKLSYSQQRLWFLDRLEGTSLFHLPIIIKFNEHVNTDALRLALNHIVNRHQILRTVILEKNDEPYQFVLEPDGLQLQILEALDLDIEDVWVAQKIKESFGLPFNLSTDRMIRALLINLTNQSSLLVITIHHIAADSLSLLIFSSELMHFYKQYSQGLPVQTISPEVQYASFAQWQQSEIQQETFSKRIGYWKEKLKNTVSLNIPTDFIRPAVQSANGAVIKLNLSDQVFRGLTDLFNKTGTPFFTMLIAAFKVLLYRYSNQQDICIGTTVGGRNDDIKNLIGFFENTIAVRTQVNGNVPFIDFLNQVKEGLNADLEHQDVPFENVVDAVVKDRDLNRNPLFDILFTNNSAIVTDKETDAATINIAGEYNYLPARFDLSISVAITNESISGTVLYATDLYTAATIHTLIKHYNILLESILKESSKAIGVLQFLKQEEDQNLLVNFNNTSRIYDADKTIIDLIEEQASRNPDNIAVVFEKTLVTYKELNERANQLAYFIKSNGVQQGMLVPICVERGIDMIVGLLGILKTGAAFVPIDPEFPLERIAYMLQDAGAAMVLSSKQSSQKLVTLQDFNVIIIDEDNTTLNALPIVPQDIVLTSAETAYVIYTSGSTGKPKGVIVSHGAVVNLLQSTITDIGFHANSSFFGVTTFSFDICYLEFFVPLVSGGKLFIGPREVVIDGYRLSENLALLQPTHMQGTPSTWQLLLDSGWQNKYGVIILIGGESVSEAIKNSLTKIASVYNMYGPTETTIWSAIKKLSKEEKVLIGKPIANTCIYILSQELQLCMPGTAGEICIGGAGLADGYLNRQDLTEEKFITSSLNGINQRLYKTGDLGRWLPDGNIECLGRMDNQVKIKGYRIELGEIETCLQQSNLISQAVVIAKENKEGQKKLVSYYIPAWQALKDKENELYLNQVSSWQQVYDTEYAEVAESPIDEEFDYDIWKDSFTGHTFEEDAMKEWLQHTVDVILQDAPAYILEIGSGKGLIYYRLTGKIKKYIGTDFSASCIHQIKQRIDKGLKEYAPADLYVCAAHEVSIDENEEVDTIVINSVAQHFPGEDYMNEVILKGIGLLKGKGRIVIGDVRNSRLLEAFKRRLDVHKLPASLNINELTWLTEQEVLKEEELLFSPEFFYNFQALHPSIDHIDIQLKRGNYSNELSKYRFDAIIYVGFDKPVFEPVWQSWQSAASTQTMLDQVEKSEPVIAVKNLPNPRLYQEKILSNALESKILNTVGELKKLIARQDNVAMEITEMLEKARLAGYEVRMYPHQDIYKMNVLLQLKPNDHFVKQLYLESGPFTKSSFTNIPLFTDISLLIQKEIKYLLSQSLPEYMIPAEFHAIAKLPLTNNGKVDRKFLSEREDKVLVNTSNYEAPRSNNEQVLVEIWQELLGVERIGIYDNFFELGGHSLLATRTVSAVRKKLGAELFIKDLFLYPTIAALADNVIKTDNSDGLPAVTVQQRGTHIPLSFSQERLWFIDRLEGSLQYHLPTVLKLTGKLNKEALAHAFRMLVNRHEVLRTVFLDNEGVAYQHILPQDGFLLSLIDGTGYKEDVKALRTKINKLIDQPFNLAKDHVIRVTLIELQQHEHMLVVNIHHIATDGWSAPIMLNELVELYNACNDNRTPTLQPVNIQYADFSIWQRQQIPEAFLNNKIAYWKTKLDGVATLQLPLDYPRPAMQSRNGATVNFKINKEISSALQSLSQQQGATLFMTLLTAFNVLLHRYTGQQDICVGTPIAGRQQHELEDLIGFFVNTLALRNEIAPDLSFTELLKQVKTNTLEAYENQEAPFEKVVEVIIKERDISRNPLFQVMLVLLNTPDIKKLPLDELQLKQGMPESALQHTSIFELTLFITETERGLKCTVEYCTDLFNDQTIRRMMAHFVNLLKAIVKMPNQAVGLLSILDQQETNRLLNQFNNTAAIYPANENIVSIFEQQVNETPNAIAIVFENESCTYKELNSRSARFAKLIIASGVKQGTMVPVCLHKGIDMMVATIAVLKAGAAYVPVDPAYPTERISFMMVDTQAKIAIAGKQTIDLLPAIPGLEIVDIISMPLAVTDANDEIINQQLNPENLAYVIYTSGSTGIPKGVLVTHQNVVSLVKGINYTSFTQKDTLLSTGSPSFDATTMEYWGMLLNGGKLVLCTDQKLLDNKLLKEIVINNNINKMWFTSSWFNQLVEADITLFKSLETILVGGEKLSEHHIEKLRRTYPSVQIINGYGPTENTTFSLTYNITETTITKPVPLGKPLNNRSAFIIDGNGQLVPVGVYGEICLGGAGLSKGYLNQAALTAEKFVKTSFLINDEINIYKSGDIGRWLPDGTIEYAGRIDEQVKIRGYRVEPGEIEAILFQSNLLRNVLVVANKDNTGTNRLIAYIVPLGVFDKEAIASYLRGKVPEYMIPAVWVTLDHIPLSPNGKIDKKALPNAEMDRLPTNRLKAPENELEEKLLLIWQQLLAVQTLGITDNFFEVGGHSLSAIRLASIIRQQLELEVSVNDIFIYPTIVGLAKHINNKGGNNAITSLAAKYLIPIKKGNNKVPLYIIAGGGGTALNFKKFGELLKADQPIYVLQPPIDDDALTVFPDTVENIAATFIEEILVQNPDGPYALSGHCLGGIIAFEMARQLTASGKSVKLLALFDTIIGEDEMNHLQVLKKLPGLSHAFKSSLSYFFVKLNFQFYLLSRYTKYAIGNKLTRLKPQPKPADEAFDDSVDMKVFKKLEQIFLKAYKNYQIPAYSGDLVLFYAKDHYYFYDKEHDIKYRKLALDTDIKNRWNSLAKSTTIYDIDGEHSTIFHTLNGREFAKLLQRHLDTCEL